MRLPARLPVRILVALAAALAALLLPALLAHADTTSTFTPGAAWDDTSGNALQMHGLGIIKVGGTWYGYGEDKAGETSSNTSFQAIPCYSSTDLQHWTFQGDAVTRAAIDAVQRAVAVVGNNALTRRNPLERHLRDVLCSRVHTPKDDSILAVLGQAALGV
ncbi:MAG TPA: hypothetical protein VG296_02360 [Actinospica sp.]|nr:hypothetical protein [Actinospica sp.]HWG22934.1 hypothetical protein [Actinospica sp.]